MLPDPFTILLRYGVTMRRSLSALLSVSNLSTTSISMLALCVLVFSALFSASSFAQESGRRTLPATEAADQDQAQKRAEWNSRGREVPKGESVAALRLRAHQQKMAMRTYRAAAERAAGTNLASTPQTTSWVGLGPAPLASDATGNGFQDYNWVSGRATSVLIDPADTTGNTVFLGGAYGGLWKSTNAGSKSATPDLVTWQSLIDDLPSLAVGAIALEPGTSNVILVGTGETNASGDSYYGMGILRSTDGGANWMQITAAASGQSFLGIGFSKIAFSTSNPNLVVASTAGNLGFDFGLEQDGVSTARGLYYSIDAGATWNRVTLSDSAIPASVTGVVYNPSQGTTGTFYAAIRRHGIYSSTDGQHFTRLATQPTTGLASANCPAGSNSSGCGIYRAEFAVTPGRNETYIWVVDVQVIGGQSTEVDKGVWRTINGGTAWTQIPDTGITTCGDSGGCGVQQGVYNLELAAVPNSTGTDVYAGTINLYKCTLTSNTQTACSQGNWINLTHVYGCSIRGELAHVHPDQHGLAFMVVGSKSPGYFAHDGGISRSLDGYTGLNSGTCTTSNQFDSLSQTLGSMTEFVSFSVHPTSADILLGGSQDNGSPKTSAATSSTSWQNALGGDGGFNVINPNPGNGGDGIAGDEWFMSRPNSTIAVCEQGTLCNDQNAFLEAGPGQGIDQGAFYTPFMLDPQDTNEMLIGTCRVWRGDTLTSAFGVISNNFDTGTAALCTGGETNQVAGLAAGGPKDASGFSNVVYATTSGFGPFSPVTPTGGEVWTTTTATSGTMTNVTGSINPKHYAIASVAIDTSVANGQTAYVGIMGFHTSHVWKTTNAGTAWTDWTGTGPTTLPDAPVSSLLVDPVAGLIYAGTDVGLFSSPTSGSAGSWTEVGPAASSGSGFLPSAPVTAIRIFTSGATKKLRVSTYGRGIWEFDLVVTPDFSLSAAPSSLSITPGGAGGTSTITVTDVGGFTGSVALVASGLPTGVTASFNPTSTTTTSVLTLTASGAATAGTATVTITGTSGSLTHTTTIALTVTGPPDFALSANPGAVTLKEGANGPNTITVSPSNGFAGSVSLAASGLPTGVTASFNPTSTTTTSVLTLTASNSATPTTATVTITGTSGSLVHTTTVALTVLQNFAVTTPTTPAPSPVLAGEPATSTFTVTAFGGAATFVNAVTFACNGLPDPTVSCGFSTVAQGATSPQTVTLTITTTGPNTAGARVPRQRTDNRSPWLPLALPLAGIVIVGFAGRKMSRYSTVAGLCVSLTLIGLLIACGGGSTPPAVGVNVSPTGSTLFPNDAADAWPPQTATFTATVTNNTNTAVTWSVSPASAGSITSGGAYTAPTIATGLPTSATITATSQADSTKTAHATVTITPSTVPGAYPLTVTATEGSVSNQTSGFTLNVN